jgi:signal transduction histidine kinase
MNIIKKRIARNRGPSFERSGAKMAVLLGMSCLFLAIPGRGIAGPVSDVPGLVTNLADLVEMVSGEEVIVVPLQIGGTVWWSSRSEGRVILHDDTSTVQLELDLPCQIPAQGDYLRIEGDCSLVQGIDAIKLSDVPVVENNGLHTMTEASGSIRLKAGLHPIRVAWFNRTDQYGLLVEYEGPALSRQPIPDSALFRSLEDPAIGAMKNAVNGLDYRCLEGQWWSLLPNFDHAAAVKTGVSDNFDIAVRSRDNHVGLQFNGFIEIPRDGLYTFYVRSDDGSRLFIGESSLAVNVQGGETPGLSRSIGSEVFAPEEQEYQWTGIEGIVASVYRPQGGLEVELMTEAGRVKLKVAEDSDGSYTLRPQNRIRAVGVSRSIHDLDGQWTRSEFFVQRWEDIEQQYVTPKIWAEYPVMLITNLLEAASNTWPSVVHLSGRVSSSEPGQPMWLEDNSGRIILDGTLSDERVILSSEVLGRVSMENGNLVLNCVHFRQLGDVDTEGDSLPVLTTIEQIYQLGLTEAARGYPVKIRGVITSPMESDSAIIQDSTRGIYLSIGKPIPLHPGDYCEVEGVTGPYEFTPFIKVSRLQKLGRGSLPDPVHPTWDQLINGSLHCNYVELEGVVAAIDGDTFTLLTRDGRINVRLSSIGPGKPENVLGATVRLRGCLFAERDEPSRRVVVGSIYLDHHWVAIIHPAPTDPFFIPLKRVSDLLYFDPEASALQRVKVSGRIVYRDGDLCCLMDGENGLRFLPAEKVTAHIGDRVEVVGFPDLSGPSPLLRDAVLRSLGRADLPPPRKLTDDDLMREEYDATLVQIDGTLLSVKDSLEGYVLDVQSGVRRFTATVRSRRGLDENMVAGCRVQLTGVYLGQGGNRVLGRPIDSFQLLLNSESDIRVLSYPPWWTLTRMLVVLGLLLGVLFAALVWIRLLHTKVEERTEQLGDQIRKRQRAERYRGIEQERARVSSDLHDDLGASLTEVNMLTSLIKSPMTTADEKARYVDELNERAQRMVRSLDEIVWALNPRNDKVASLSVYFCSYARQFFELASVGFGMDAPENLPDEPLDPKVRRELFFAFREALNNVVRHADATKVRLRIALEEGVLVVTVTDDGRGIPDDQRDAGADGLLNMQARMNALGGKCRIESDPRRGTTVRLEAPIQKELEQ